MMRGRKPTLPAILAGTALAAVLAAPSPAPAQEGVLLSDRVTALTAGLFCAPPEGGRRPAPDTVSGWVHIPDEPVQLIAEGRSVPAVLGLGFGVRYRLDSDATHDVRYRVTHPPMAPAGATEQGWSGTIVAGNTDTVFFQFDIEDELLPGDWSFSASVEGQQLFSVTFTVRPAADLPGLAGLCRDGSLLSVIPAGRAAAG